MCRILIITVLQTSCTAAIYDKVGSISLKGVCGVPPFGGLSNRHETGDGNSTRIHTCSLPRRVLGYGAVTGALWKRRRTQGKSTFSSTSCLLFLASRIQQDVTENEKILERSNRISTVDFAFNFNGFGDQDCLFNFRFKKADVIRMIDAVAWPSWKQSTSRNRYATTPILATCLVLRRVASPARWADLEYLFGKHHPQLSEIYWEAMEHMWNTYKHLLTTLPASLLQHKASTYANAIHAKGNALPNCVGFIDGTVIGIARPKGYKRQKVVYNGHKRKHALKYQAVNTSDGMILNAYGPMEGRRHDWTLYIQSQLDDALPTVLVVAGRRYCIYGDSGYNRRWYLEVPFQGSSLSAAQKAFNRAMSSIRITVEWIFKEIKMHFTIVDFKLKMKLLESPIGLLFLCCMFLANCRNCLYPNQISQFFGCRPPTLEEYLQQEYH